LNIQEMLDQNKALKEAAEQQWSDYREGKAEKPAIAVETFDMIEKMCLNSIGNFSKGRVTVRETLMTGDIVKMIPKVIEGKLREAAEPEYLATRFMKTVQVNDGSSAVYVIPIVGEVVAHEVTEGGRYQEEKVDFSTLENGTFEIRVKKIGVKVSITEEAVTDGAWDILGINIAKMGRAMARYKEEWCLNEFSTHGHIIFDNALRSQMPEAGTSGRAADGSYNDTLSTEDFIDLVLAMMGNDRVPTDVIMHPLTWVIFARNSMIGNGLTYGAFGGQMMHPWGATQGTPGFAGLAAQQGSAQPVPC
jgi:HK97 family phage major capsid protein